MGKPSVQPAIAARDTSVASRRRTRRTGVLLTGWDCDQRVVRYALLVLGDAAPELFAPADRSARDRRHAEITSDNKPRVAYLRPGDRLAVNAATSQRQGGGHVLSGPARQQSLAPPL